MSEQAGRYQRTFSGLIGALVVLLAVVFAFVALRALNRDDLNRPVREVDYTDSLDFWQSQARFELLAPASLPEGWKATSARFEGGRPQSWHLGVLTDENDYVGIEQQRADVATMVGEFVDEEAVEGDPVRVAGATWQSFSDDGGDHALVRRHGGVTTVVVGSLSQDELVRYVASLR